jgi:arabinan endo-1,5-alpha-L-arabinosidase
MGLLSMALASRVDGPARADPAWAFPGDGEASINAREVHDPRILRVDSTWFCFNTNGKGCGLLRSSPDLHHWTKHGPLLPSTPPWLQERIPDHRALWAPDVVETPAGLRMYDCASLEFGRNASWLGLAECPDFDPAHPLDGWRDAGRVIDSFRGRDDFNAIDPEVAIGEDGRHWLFFGARLQESR